MKNLYNESKLADANLLMDLSMNVSNCELHTEYRITGVHAKEADMKDFLLHWGVSGKSVLCWVYRAVS